MTSEEKMVMEPIGMRIAVRRKELGMTQEQLAEKIGLSWQGSVCRIERGQVSLHAAMLQKIADALKVDAGSLLSGSEGSKKARRAMSQLDRQTVDELSYDEAFQTLLEAERLIGKLRNRLRKQA